MSGSGQDNSSGAGSTNPVVRLRGFPKKTADPPPSAPIPPPKAPNAPAEVRFKRRTPIQPTVEDVTPPAAAPPPVDEAVFADAAAPAEYPGETVEPYQEYPVEQMDQAYQEPFQAAPAEQGYETYQEPFEAAPVEPEQTYQEPLAEVPAEQYAANEAPVAPASGGTADAPVAARIQEVVPKSPDPPAAANPNAGGVRLRLPLKAVPSTVQAPPPRNEAGRARIGGQDEIPSHSAASGQSGNRPDGPSAAPPGLPYKPDTDLDRIYRRQWWKHDLKVKAGRWQAEEAQK
jgi:hypothetical protein